MSLSPHARLAGLVLGLAAFVAAGLFAVIGAKRPAPAAAVSVPAADLEPARALGRAYAAAAARVRPAVVSVYSERLVSVRPPAGFGPFGEDFFQPFLGPGRGPGAPHGNAVPQRGMGSGMILDRDGDILTNFHVVADVDEIKVQLADRRSFSARLVGSDPRADVAVIRLSGRFPDDLPTVQLGDSDAIEVGHLVLAIGAPFGLAQTVTHGIISAKSRSNVGIADFEDFLQTDAPINPGNSGGPLIDIRGDVVGMNSAIATGGGGQSAGVGFAIPSNMITAMLPTLIKGGKIARGALGVTIQDVSDDIAQSFRLASVKGVVVADVGHDSAAEKAGIQPGDVIVRFAGQEVADSSALRKQVAATPPGQRVDVVVVRDGKERTLHIVLGLLPSN